MIVIGAGGHAQDIISTLDFDAYPVEESEFRGDESEALIGVNDPQVRAGIFDRWPDQEWWNGGTWIHPNAHLGIHVFFGVHVHINAGAFLTRCQIGHFTTIGPNATICGDVKIGARCLIGAGATIKNLVTIGDDVTVGAGAVVVNDLPDGVTVVGVPARQTGRRRRK